MSRLVNARRAIAGAAHDPTAHSPLPHDLVEALPRDLVEALPRDLVEALPRDLVEALPRDLVEANRSRGESRAVSVPATG